MRQRIRPFRSLREATGSQYPVCGCPEKATAGKTSHCALGLTEFEVRSGAPTSVLAVRELCVEKDASAVASRCTLGQTSEGTLVATRPRPGNVPGYWLGWTSIGSEAGCVTRYQSLENCSRLKKA